MEASAPPELEPASGNRGPDVALSGWLILGFAVVGAVWAVTLLRPGVTDMDQIWYAARALLEGKDPYRVIGPGRADSLPWPFYYPLTAAIVGLPLALLPLSVARTAFVASGGGLVGYVLARYRPRLWPLAFSLPFCNAAWTGQWSLYLAASLALPWLGPVAAAKPNVALALLAGARSRRHALWLVCGAAVVLAVSLLWRPEWPWTWRATLADAEHFRPLIIRPGGILMLLALLRWRDPDARLLLGLAVIPQTGMWYEAAPALLVLRTWPEAGLITVLTHIAHLVSGWHRPGFTAESWHIGTLTLWSVLIPALVIVLRRRANG